MKKLFLTLQVLVFISSAYAQEVHMQQDSIAITTADNRVYQRVCKYEYSTIAAKVPELWQYNRVVMPPDSLYLKKSRINKIDDLFRGESGKDDYFVWYAWFLKNEIGADIYQSQRDTLLYIYTLLNSAVSEISGGGTYFNHNYKRASAYVEFAIYSRYVCNNAAIDVIYSKQEVIDGVWQMLSLYDNGNNFPLQVEAGRLHRVYEYIWQIDCLITNDFSKKWLQELVNNFATSRQDA